MLLNFELWAYRQLSEDERNVLDMYAPLMRKLKAIAEEKIRNGETNPWLVPMGVLNLLTTEEQLVILRHDQIRTKMESIAEGRMFTYLDTMMSEYESRLKEIES